jgi:hypothetical protein
LSVFPVSKADWQEFIHDYSADLLRLIAEDRLCDVSGDDLVIAGITDKQRASAWLGHDAASEEEVGAAERRLGTALPPSYRNFLLVSDGLIGPGAPWFFAVLPARRVNWLRNAAGTHEILDQFRVSGLYGDKYGEEMCAMLRRTLWPMSSGGGDYWLLDPGRGQPSNEWTACS